MNPQILAWLSVGGFVLNLFGWGYTLLKVSFMAGEQKQKIANLDERMGRVEDWQDRNFRGVAAGK